MGEEFRFFKLGLLNKHKKINWFQVMRAGGFFESFEVDDYEGDFYFKVPKIKEKIDFLTSEKMPALFEKLGCKITEEKKEDCEEIKFKLLEHLYRMFKAGESK